MNIRDYFKNSVWESFVGGQGLTADFVTTAVIAMVLAVILGLCIYKIYGIYFGGVVFSSAFAVTLVGMTVLSCMLTLAISSNIVISLGMIGALSIVRYRTAIKDPMDLLYLFGQFPWALHWGRASMCWRSEPWLSCFLSYIYFITEKERHDFILVAHYISQDAGDEIIRIIHKMKHQLKSKTIRGEVTELTMELVCRTDNTVFLEQIQAVEGVQDATLIQYNGEYHG